MRTETHRLTIPCLRHDLWRFLADYRNDLKWRKELTECELIAGTPGEVGARYRAVIGWEGLTNECDVECTACVASDLVAYRGRVGDTRVDCEYRLEDADGGVRVDVTLSLDMDASYAILEPFGWAILTRWARADGPELSRAFLRTLA